MRHSEQSILQEHCKPELISRPFRASALVLTFLLEALGAASPRMPGAMRIFLFMVAVLLLAQIFSGKRERMEGLQSVQDLSFEKKAGLLGKCTTHPIV